MKRKSKSPKISFERILGNVLSSYGYLFPQTDRQMEAYEKTAEMKELPEDLRTPDFVFKKCKP